MICYTVMNLDGLLCDKEAHQTGFSDKERVKVRTDDNGKQNYVLFLSTFVV